MMLVKVKNAEGQTAVYKREIEDLLRLHEEKLAELETVQNLLTRTSQELQQSQQQVKEMQEHSGQSRSLPTLEPLSLSVQTSLLESSLRTCQKENTRQRSEILELKKSLAFSRENLAAKDEEVAELQARCNRLDNEAKERQEVSLGVCRPTAAVKMCAVMYLHT
jgi:hypothetical protein